MKEVRVVPAAATNGNGGAAAPDHPPEDDVVAEAAGDCGPWQYKLTAMLSLFYLPSTWHMTAITFQIVPPPFFCPNNTELSCADVNETQTCDKWEFNTTMGETIVSEWELVCDRQHLINIAMMAFLMGVTIGGLVSGLLSDRFGRRKTLGIFLGVQVVCGTGIAVAPWLWLFMVLRFMLGWACVSVVFSAFVLCMEVVGGGRWRTLAGVGFHYPVPLGYLSVAAMAWALPDWRHLQLAVALPAAALFVVVWALPESPRWLLAVGRRARLTRTLRAAAAANKRTLPDALLERACAPRPPPSAGLAALLRTPRMRRVALLVYVQWFALYLAYFGLVLNLGNVAGQIHLNTVLSGLVELPAIALSTPLLLRHGRRVPLFGTMAAGGLFCILTTLVPHEHPYREGLTLTLVMLGRFAFSFPWVMLPVFTAELFPTVVRNVGVGSANLVSGIALMLVPNLWNLATVWDGLPLVTMGVLAICGGASVMLLPETANKALPDTVEQFELAT